MEIRQRRRRRGRTKGFTLLEVMIALFILGVLILMVFRFANGQREDLSIETTLKGFESIMDGAYSHLVDQGSWTSDFNVLQPHIPNINVISASQAGTNGEGNPYSISVNLGEFRISTTLSSKQHARAVQLRLGSTVSLSEAGGIYTVELGVPMPGNITLLRSTLQIDGSNRMQAPLPIDSAALVTANAVCEGLGIAVGTDGRVYECVDQTPLDSDPTRHWTPISAH